MVEAIYHIYNLWYDRRLMEEPQPQHPVLEAIARLDWVFAKTMPEWPHEYSVRRKAWDEADYVALWNAIMTDGVVMGWRYGTRYTPCRYLYPGDGWRYWSMSARRSIDNEGHHPLEI